MIYIKIKCPRCGKKHFIPEYQSGVWCDCHLKCPKCGEFKMEPYTPTIYAGPGYGGELKYFYWHPNCPKADSDLDTRSKKREMFVDAEANRC